MVDPTVPDLATKKLYFAGTVIAVSKSDATAKKPKTRIHIGEFEGSDLFLLPFPGSHSPASPFFVPAWCVRTVKPEKAAEAVTCAIDFTPPVKLAVPMSPGVDNAGSADCEAGLETASVDVEV
eukprot:15436681-Alexandrium_andersonii.AAC.1